MSITVNTNMQALRIQNNLNNATSKMNTAMERMSSGTKINSASDDAAGYAVKTKLSYTLSSSAVASDNVSVGQDLLSSTEGTLSVIETNLQRIRDLTEQASNGTYSSDDLAAISKEVTARLEEITSLSTNTSFNGKKLLDGSLTAGVSLQVGTAGTDTMTLDSSIFTAVSGAVSGLTASSALIGAITTGGTSASAFLTSLDSAISNVTTRVTQIGAASNKLDAAADNLTVQQTNLSSAKSTIADADVAQESATYVQSKILQSASATLLVQANSAPQIALTLIQG